ncbi:MAG TPA: RluA family pseudouridine synthase [Terriglobales bacterium]|nr:RluA family pseudouridine synthase [Terriglobales bacterium]
MPAHGPSSTFEVAPEQAGRRLDQFLVSQLPEVSRARLQQLIAAGKVLVNDSAPKASLKLKGGERIQVLGTATPPPLRAIAEEIPLDVVYEDNDLAVINKPAGMMVHAGAGATEDEHNRGTLVNALLHRFGQLSGAGGELRPGIVHRLDRGTSGLIVVAKNDFAHQRLGAQFSGRQVRKQYIALVHGWLKQEAGTIKSAISRDRIRRTRMTTRRSGGREAVTHYKVRERVQSDFGKFSLLDLKIDTGRTHQIRVHLASLGHPVVGDTLYGAPRELRPQASRGPKGQPLSLARNFLHAAALEFAHPRTGKALSFSRPLPPELLDFLGRVGDASGYNGESG